MPIEQIVTLALVQGITEFLPISSSGHLVLVPLLVGWADQGPLVDIAVHVGTLLAVMVYFRHEVGMLVRGFFHLARGRVTKEARLLLLIVLASLPIFVAGFFLLSWGVVSGLRTLEIIAWANLVFGLALWATDAYGLTIRRVEHTTVLDALMIGASQILAVIPGVSRSGITMTTARMLGYERTDAARFSMLLAMPTIAAAGAAAAWELYRSGDLALQADAGFAAALAFASAILSIWFMMALLRRATMLVFVVYRIALSIALFAVIYGLIANPAGG